MTKEKTSFIYPILITSMFEIDMMGNEANDVLNKYRALAVALCNHANVDVKSEMAEFDREIKEFKKSDTPAKANVPKEVIGEFMHQVLDMCKTMRNQKKILKYINTAYEILEINEPKYALY